MSLSKLLFIGIGLFSGIYLFAQPTGGRTDLSRVDSLARTVKYKRDLYELTNELTASYSDPWLKARAIFVWVTDNVRYDYRAYNKQKQVKMPKCKQGADCNLVFAQWELRFLHQVIVKGKAVCNGYARLYKKMCDIAGLKCEVVSGYTKTRPYQVGITGAADHVWNAVWLDSTYYWLDATWAAGTCTENEETGKLVRFNKQFNNYYWLTASDDFLRNHYPQEAKWVAGSGYTKEKFAANPYYAGDIISKINLISPSSGVINAKKGDTIRFQFTYKGNFKHLQVNSNFFRNPPIWTWEKVGRRKIWREDTLAWKKQRYIDYKVNGERYDFEYVVPDESLFYLEILFDYRRVMRFKVIIQKETN